jgi:outer membrane receptor protein involved in Fe transport
MLVMQLKRKIEQRVTIHALTQSSQRQAKALLLIGLIPIGLMNVALAQTDAEAPETKTTVPVQVPANTGSQSDSSTENGSAPAASPAAPETARLPEIVVTAQKRGEGINSVPMSVSSYRGEELKTFGVTNTSDLGKLVPGFTSADSGFDIPIYTLRGVGFADTSFATSSTVGLYSDQVSLAYPIMSKGANLDIRRVEILKGPQGTLYGRNSTGGTINYISNTPTGTFQTGGEVSEGSYGRVDAESYVSGPITDSLKGRFAINSITSATGWQESHTRPGDTLGRLNKQAARGILDWQSLDDVLVRFTLSGWRDQSEPQAPYAIALQPQNPFFGTAGLDPTVANYPIIPDNKNPRIADWNPNRDFKEHDNFWMASLRPSWDISDNVNLTGLFTFQQVRSDGTALPSSGLNVEDIDQVINAFVHSYSAEVRLSGKLGERANWSLGVNGDFSKQHEVNAGYSSENSLNIGIFGDTPPLDRPIFFQVGGAKSDALTHSGSVFADADWEFIETLKLTLGARATRENENYQGCTLIFANNDSILPFPYFTIASFIRGGDTVVPAGSCGSIGADGKPGLVVGSLGAGNVSYRSVLSWTPIEPALFYASYSRGYKSGGFPTIFAVDQSSLAPVVQEKLDAYEVGTKLTAPGGGLQVNFSAFYYDYTNKQLLTYFKDPVFGALQYLQNVPKSLDEGLELTTIYSPLRKLYLTAAGSYIRTKVIQYTGDNSQGTAFDFAGQPFNYTPRLQASLIAAYTFALTHHLDVAPGASFTYTGGTNSTLEHDPLFALNAHRVYDVHVSLAPPDAHWSVSAYGRNITNEFYRNSVIKLGDSVFAYTGLPLMVGVALTVDLR